MKNAIDRLSGLFFVLFALALWLYLIPTQIETVDYGAIRPKTLPQILAVILGLFGALLMIKPADGTDLSQVPWAKTIMIIAVLVAGLWLVVELGFVYSATPLALTLIFLMGERRPLWISIGGFVIPALIWYAVTILLERPLP
ncbi:tripartite tricarboxylate transporter TctB family protein [Sulfitobacter sp. F26204]|uniref:tripartite tricarboxylate transporter TctB family protein n=1 Tax=Sulfitobacter sp. F26204 TaxID=2996014 RepID=UPI00225E343D|nr:tripartite tricarboxylate transporter TctB family protein [Sulfitobacter sp. F26204]MCX7560232.1 tripartite tricarboxylate transporter TctB family protein [Sulfitobacter sp. F26204]